ncbi:substrate-binding periplasmic protein [Pseudoduganella sp. UC29_106]|uniref:substrate-binding periplasmic protein n=1 Tax=Pseudoduganella sp. UC29_106 TaxID=3374553 RepID=UPI0037574EEE
MNPGKRAFLLQFPLLLASLIGLPQAGAQPQSQTVSLIMGEALDEAGRSKPLRAWQRKLFDYLEGELNVSFDLKRYPWPRAERHAINGDGLIFGLPKSAERERTLRFSEPTVSNTLWLVTRSDQTFAFNSMADLRGKKIGAVRGYGYGDEFERARSAGLFRVEDDLPSRAMRLQRLLLKRVDAVLLYQPNWQTAAEFEAELRAQAAPLANDLRLPPDITLSVLPRAVQMETPLYFAIARGRDDALIDRINQALLKQQKQASLRNRRS